MTLHDSLRSQAKIDSRRFGKGIVCEIVRGRVLDFIIQKDLGPRQTFFNEHGLDVVNLSMLVIPTTSYSKIEKLVSELDNIASDDVDVLGVLETKTQAVINAVTQAIILVTIEKSTTDGHDFGQDPETTNVLIDSNDVNQTIMGRYTPKTAANIRNITDWRKDDTTK